jgi:alcohol dehydrogenase
MATDSHRADPAAHDPYGTDLQFAIYQPTRITFGVGVAREVSLELKRLEALGLGGRRGLVITDAFLAEKTPLVRDLQKALGERHGATWTGVVADAEADTIDAGAAFARDKGCDTVISLGGGSAIDTAKGIAIVLSEGGQIRDHQGSQRLPKRPAPHVAIPTTAGTGSEVSSYAVVKDARAKEKMHFADDKIIPDVAVLDPALTVGMPRMLTAATGLDALTHAVEAYASMPRNPLCDAQAAHAARLVGRYLLRACDTGTDLVARGQMLLASNLAGLAFNGSGVGLCHALAHVVGARHGVHHGTANAILLPHVVRFNAVELAERYRELAQALDLDVRDTSDALAAESLANAISDLIAESGLPTRLRDSGVPEADLEACADQALSDGAIVYNGRFAADVELTLEVLRAAF